MAWVRLEDTMPENPKIEAVGGDGGWLHICAITYCNRQLTDGLIKQTKAARLTEASNDELCKLMIETGLWHGPGHDCDECTEVPEGHYLVHGYLTYQRSRQDVEKQREYEREKKRKQREKGAANIERDREGRFVSRGDTDRDSFGDSSWESRGESSATQKKRREIRDLSNDKSLLQNADERSVEIIEVSNGRLTTAKKDCVWDAMLSACGIDPAANFSKSARGAYNAAAKGLRGRGVTPDDIHAVAAAFRSVWPRATLTPTALDRRFDEVVAHVKAKPSSGADLAIAQWARDRRQA